ncbi:MAG: HAD hydrolase-like protein, partial [Chloroflexota bacterium]|nr:HAD hydrolase-like protein [Chloroflexota bacterium]
MPAGVVFDLDGTLIDTVYDHVLVWREVFESVGVDVAAWRIHSCIGMSGPLLIDTILRAAGHPGADAAKLEQLSSDLYLRRVSRIR